jgi:hypothetical protein
MSKALSLQVLLLFSVFALASASFSQTSTTYLASKGTVSSLNATTGYLDLGGSFRTPNSFGGGCYYGGCPDWTFSGFTLSYVLPDGSTATFTNFTGSANFTHQFDIPIQGTASGFDNTGAPVSVSVSWTFKASCRSGRGGGCWKTFLSGQLTVTK